MKVIRRNKLDAVKFNIEEIIEDTKMSLAQVWTVMQITNAFDNVSRETFLTFNFCLF